MKQRTVQIGRSPGMRSTVTQVSATVIITVTQVSATVIITVTESRLEYVLEVSSLE